MGDWRVGTVADAAVPRGLVGGPFGSKLVSRDYAETGVPVIRGKNLGQGRFVDLSDAVFVSHEKFARDLRTNDAKPGDLVFTQRGTLGQVAVMPSDAPIAVVSQSQMRLRVNHEVVDPWFVYYWATSPSFLRLLDDRAIVAGVPHINLGILAAMPLPLPPLDEQRRIAAVLGAFDDLIETNRSLVTRLRDQASRVYALASEDGAVIPFDDVADLVRDGIRAADLTSGTPYVGLEHFDTEGGGLVGVGDAGSVDSNKTRFRAGDVLYGKLRPYFRKFDRPGFDGVCSTEIWVLRPKSGWGGGIVNAIVARQAFTDFAMAGSGGTRMPRADWNHVRSMPVEVPAVETREGTERILDRLWQAQVQLSDEIVELARTRDELLPLLMSGRVRVEDVEGMV